MAAYVIEIEDTGLGDPVIADRDGKPVELFIGHLAYKVTRMDKHDD